MTSKHRVFSITPVFTEADRYLVPMLTAVRDVVDGMFVYDDQSTDASEELARWMGASVVVRPHGTSSFLNNEGEFRQAAWDAFEEVMQPKWGDWVLAIDADEFMVTSGACCVRCDIESAIKAADLHHANSVRIPIPEVFGFDDDGTPLVRTDGFWGSIRGHRLFRYLKHGIYSDASMGCGAEPINIINAAVISDTCYGLKLMHYGYARKEDQRRKHIRYTSLTGHNSKHVQSIVAKPTLKRWEGPVPKAMAA